MDKRKQIESHFEIRPEYVRTLKEADRLFKRTWKERPPAVFHIVSWDRPNPFVYLSRHLRAWLTEARLSPPRKRELSLEGGTPW